MKSIDKLSMILIKYQLFSWSDIWEFIKFCPFVMGISRYQGVCNTHLQSRAVTVEASKFKDGDKKMGRGEPFLSGTVLLHPRSWLVKGHRSENLTYPLQYTLLTLKYGVNLLNTPLSSVLRQNLHATWTATGSVFPLRYSETYSTSTNYLLLSYESVGSCCGM